MSQSHAGGGRTDGSQVTRADRQAIRHQPEVGHREGNLSRHLIWEEELREYENLTGTEVEEYWKIITLKKILPEKVRTMLQTMNIVTYKESKEYALHQARALRTDNPSRPTLDQDLNESEEKKKVTIEDDQSPGTEASKEEWEQHYALWLPKGGKGSGAKGTKGSFKGNCYYCGVPGHRLNECRKKDADMA